MADAEHVAELDRGKVTIGDALADEGNRHAAIGGRVLDRQQRIGVHRGACMVVWLMRMSMVLSVARAR